MKVFLYLTSKTSTKSTARKPKFTMAVQPPRRNSAFGAINEKQKDFEFVARISMRHAVNYPSSAPQGRFFYEGMSRGDFCVPLILQYVRYAGGT